MALCGRKARSAAIGAGDIYIAAGATMDASDRDVVRVRLSRSRPAAKAACCGRRARSSRSSSATRTSSSARIIEERGGTGYVQVDGKSFAQPVPVGDPGAKGAEAGRQGRHRDGPLSRRISTTGEGGDRRGPRRARRAGRRYALDHPRVQPARRISPTTCSTRPAQQAEAFDESIGGRLDLTGETTITIDPVDARDFDDAISLDATTTATGAGRPHRRRVALRAARVAARPRGPRARHERLSARPRDPDAAGGDLATAWRACSRTGPLHAVGADRVHRRTGSVSAGDVQALGDQGSPPVHLRRGR